MEMHNAVLFGNYFCKKSCYLSLLISCSILCTCSYFFVHAFLQMFVRDVHEANWLNGMELSIYDSWFDPVLSSLPGLIPDGFIYLRATPDTCHKRMMLRSRSEEGSVTLQYLQDLHEKHECWLLPSQHGDHRLLSASQLPYSMDHSLHPDIKDRVFYLEGSRVHSSIQKVSIMCFFSCEKMLLILEN